MANIPAHGPKHVNGLAPCPESLLHVQHIAQPGQKLPRPSHLRRCAQGAPAHILPQHLNAPLLRNASHTGKAPLQVVDALRRHGVAGIARAMEHIVFRAQGLTRVAGPGENIHGVLLLAAGAAEQIRLKLGALGMHGHALHRPQQPSRLLAKGAVVLAEALQKDFTDLNGEIPQMSRGFLGFHAAVEGRAAQAQLHGTSSVGLFSSSSVRLKDGANSRIKSSTSSSPVARIAASTFSPAASNSWLPARCSSTHFR